jgi:hypothetical protein
MIESFRLQYGRVVVGLRWGEASAMVSASRYVREQDDVRTT